MSRAMDRVSRIRRMLEEKEEGHDLWSPRYVSRKPWDIAAAKAEGSPFFDVTKVFPDAKIKVRDVAEDADRDEVVVRWSLLGTWTEPFAGIKPTGKKVNVSGITIYRFEGDQVVESWGEFDLAGLAQQTVGGLNTAACQQLAELISRPPEDRVSRIRQVLEEKVEGHNLWAPNYVSHKPWDLAAAKTEGLDRFDVSAVFPDAKITVNDVVEDVDSDQVAVRWNLRGTWKGSFAGIEPTGRTIDIGGITIYRFEGDQVVESWGEFDLASLGQQAVGGLNTAACSRLADLVSRPPEKLPRSRARA